MIINKVWRQRLFFIFWLGNMAGDLSKRKFLQLMSLNLKLWGTIIINIKDNLKPLQKVLQAKMSISLILNVLLGQNLVRHWFISVLCLSYMPSKWKMSRTKYLLIWWEIMDYWPNSQTYKIMKEMPTLF